MEVKCSRCGRTFVTNQEEMSICPDCLKGEFSSAVRLSESELKALHDEYKGANMRQAARAERMNEGYLSGEAFSPAGKIRFALGIFLFLVRIGI